MTATNRQLLDTFPWHKTSLGVQEDWPVEMRSIVQTIMASDFPVCTGWGNDIIQIYNDSYNQIFGDKHPLSFGRPLRESWPEIWPFVSEALAEVLRKGEPLVFRDTMLPLAKAGVPEECYLDFSYSAVKSLNGEIIGLMSIATETTDIVIPRRRQGVEQIKANGGVSTGIGAISESLRVFLHDNLMDCHAGVLFRLSPENGMPTETEWSIRAETDFINGVRPVVAAGLAHAGDPVVSLPGHLVQDDFATLACVLPVADSTGQLIAALLLVPHQLVPVRRSLLPFVGQLSKRLHDVLHATELTANEVQQAHEGMAEKAAMYEFLFENIRDGAIYTATSGQPDDDEVVLAINHRACEMLGYEAHEVVGMSRAEFFFAGDVALDAALHTRASDGFFVGDLTFRGKNGNPVPVEVSSNIFELKAREARSVTIIRDISARNAREREREGQMRTEVIASLTRAVAHDFNNLLTVILGSLDVLDDSLVDDANRKILERALRAAEEAGQLTSQLLTFSSRRVSTPQRLDIAGHLQEIRPLLTSAVGETNKLSYDLGAASLQCWTEHSALTSGLINLATNARHAMRNGGTLFISATSMASDLLPEAHDGHSLPADDYLVLVVRDDGPGMDESVRSRIFEPFFSTKGIGDGTGLGLPSVLTALRQNGGDIRLASTSNSGTEFLIVLPLVRHTQDEQPDNADGQIADGTVVLYVEDNALVRDQTVLMLEQLGFSLLVARNGREALDIAKTNKHIDLVLTDLVMPGGLSGRAVARELTYIRPGVPVVITTGYDPYDWSGELNGERILTKPYSRKELGSVLFQSL